MVLNLNIMSRNVWAGKIRIYGDIAQLVERVVRNDEVWGSTPHISTTVKGPQQCGPFLFLTSSTIRNSA